MIRDGDIWITLLGLGLASFVIRLGGFLLAEDCPKPGAGRAV